MEAAVARSRSYLHAATSYTLARCRLLLPVLKKETHLPVIIDPSHAGGKAWMVAALSRAGIAAGADGLLVEMHPTPSEAWCDADQAITPTELQKLMKELSAIANILGRDIAK